MRNKRILISGASIAGLTTAIFMQKLGHHVTIIEIADSIKKGGTPVNIRDQTIDIMKRMELFDEIYSKRLKMEAIEFKNSNDVTQRRTDVREHNETGISGEFEIERDELLSILLSSISNDTEIIFNESIAALIEEDNCIQASFQSGSTCSFDLVFGCDGTHSNVRKLWFGAEECYSCFMKGYGSTTIIDRLLIRDNTTQLYNEPGKAVMLNAYNGKTDIVLIFIAEEKIIFDYRDDEQKRKIVNDSFSGVGWRTAELLMEIELSKTFYFDELCQIKMPSWTKGQVALIGDAGYCASPAAGMGGSLAIDGAAALAHAMDKFDNDVALAFVEYNRGFRPFVDDIQAFAASSGLDFLVPRTDQAILERNFAS